MSMYVKTANGAALLSPGLTCNMGESGYWIYRKWSNHYLELWYKWRNLQYFSTGSSGYIYHCQQTLVTDLTGIYISDLIDFNVTIVSHYQHGVAWACPQNTAVGDGKLEMTVFICSPVNVLMAEPRTAAIMCYALCKWS